MAVSNGIFTATREDLMKVLAEEKTDEEIAHARAEDMLTSYFRGLGDSELADAWDAARNSQGWWYA